MPVAERATGLSRNTQEINSTSVLVSSKNSAQISLTHQIVGRDRSRSRSSPWLADVKDLDTWIEKHKSAL
jgi:hypothetical protein